jgi:phosphatidate cytidylyltransferase
MLKQRIITGLVLLAIIFVTLFFMPSMVFSGALLVVFTIAAWEWANFSGITLQSLRFLYATCVSGVIFFLAYLANIGQVDVLDLVIRDIVGVGCTWWAISLLWLISYPVSVVYWNYKIVKMLMGVLVLVPSAIALIYLSSLPVVGDWVFLYLVGVVVAADVGAYFIGRTFGKSKLAPLVSPGKSWAGFWGGLLSSMIFAITVSAIFGNIAGLSSMALVIVTLFTALASVLGDLVESMMKRERGIKDSSQLLPGHGGFMDRIDSITAAAPVFTLLALLLQANQ